MVSADFSGIGQERNQALDRHAQTSRCWKLLELQDPSDDHRGVAEAAADPGAKSEASPCVYGHASHPGRSSSSHPSERLTRQALSMREPQHALVVSPSIQ